MNIDVYNTYAYTADGDFLHFGVLLLRDETNKASA